MNRTLLTWLLSLTVISTMAQNQPQWTRTVTALPDSAYMFPVRTLSDANNDILVLSTYGATTGTNNKIVVTKFDNAGQQLWRFEYDHGGIGSPRGWDMALSPTGNCYIAGGFMSPPYKCLVMEVSSQGALGWVVDTTSAGLTGTFDRAIIHYDKIYVSGYSGIAVFDFNGNEKWSVAQSVSRMAVDNLGQAIVSVISSGSNLNRYDSLGNLNFSDTTIDAKRICTDSHNNIILLGDIPEYDLVKFDSAGNFMWQKNNLVLPNPFGDIGCEVLTDPDDNVYAVGLSDTMFKYDPSGNQLWWRAMNGLDLYQISAKMDYNRLVVAGVEYVSSQYNAAIAIFNSLGWRNYYGTYNSNTQQEFSVDLAINVNGFFVLEDSISNTGLLKFIITPGLTPPDFSLYCVDSVWYEPGNTQLINVRVFNGDITHINYPSMMIISPTGDTISNKYNLFNFFAQLSNSYQTYTDTISIQGITDFSGYTFVMTDNLSDTSAIISLCSTLSIPEVEGGFLSIYPNPSTERVNIFNRNQHEVKLKLYDMSGRFLRDLRLEIGENVLDISQIPAGAYFLKSERGSSFRLIKLE